MNYIKDLGSIGPLGIIPDTRATHETNVGLTEQPTNNAKPKGSISTTPNGNKLATVAVHRVQDYPNLVRDIRLDPQWNKIKYWGKR